MTLIEGMEVEYLNNSGTIDFISKNYVVIAIPSRVNPARLIVYREQFEQIQIIGK